MRKMAARIARYLEADWQSGHATVMTAQQERSCFWQNASVAYSEVFDLTLTIQSSLLEDEQGNLQGFWQLLKRQAVLIDSIRQTRQETWHNMLPQPVGLEETNAHRQAKDLLTQIIELNEKISEQILKKQQQILVKLQGGRAAKKAFNGYARTNGT